MLTSLKIKNVALIRDLTVDFSSGLNVLSGETGAGKSIMIDSLNFVLGGKADKTMIRSGEENCSVQAVVTLPGGSEGILAMMEELGAEREDTVILFRQMDGQGKNRCSMNGQAVTVSWLKSFASLLADIHGQSEHHSLMKVSSHLELVDRFGGKPVEKLAEAVAESFARYREMTRSLKALGGADGERERRMDLLKYQIDEIAEAAVKEGEEEDLKNRRARAQNAERMLNAFNEALELLRRGNESCADQLGMAERALSRASDFDTEAEKLRARLESARFEIEDIADGVSDLAEGMDLKEADLAAIEKRLDEYRLLHKKYGAGVGDILSFSVSAEAEYNRLLHAEEEIAALTERLLQGKKELYANASALSKKRRETAEQFRQAVTGELKDLGLTGASFAVQFSEVPKEGDFENFISVSGFDVAEFYLSANAGQPQKPLVKVISGGEASRFMLAVKTITADLAAVPLLVFDEIDAGISGEIAQKVAEKFAAISKRHQLLAITHLPQIAAMGDTNYLIEKHSDGQDTVTTVARLSDADKEKEVARLAGGSNVGTHGVLHARELIAWCEERKKTAG